MLWLDNFFTNEALLRALRRQGIAASGTAKVGAGLPQEAIDMRAHATHEKWGALGVKQINEYEWFTVNCKKGGPHRPSYATKGCPKAGCVVRQQREVEGGLPILCASWQDNNVVNFMTAAHTEEDFHTYEEKDRKRRKKGIRMWDPALEDKPLRIPRPFWEYNHNMGTTDQHSQLKASYTTSHPMRRVWWPLFFDLLDAAGVNGYVVHRAMIERPLDHRRFLLAVSKELREEGFRELHYLHFTGLGGLQRMSWPKGPPQGILQTTEHTRVKLAKAYCRVCLREGTRGVQGSRGALLPIDSNAKYCWNRWHGEGGLQKLRLER